jgi:hypothetical protein
MAGPVRQPIDIPSLERYLAKHVPEIIPPLDVKQVPLPLTDFVATLPPRKKKKKQR